MPRECQNILFPSRRQGLSADFPRLSESHRRHLTGAIRRSCLSRAALAAAQSVTFEAGFTSSPIFWQNNTAKSLPKSLQSWLTSNCLRQTLPSPCAMPKKSHPYNFVDVSRPTVRRGSLRALASTSSSFSRHISSRPMRSRTRYCLSVSNGSRSSSLLCSFQS